MHLGRLQNETTIAKSRPQAAPTQQNQLEPRKRNSSTGILYIHIFFSFVREDFLLSRSFISPCLLVAYMRWRQGNTRKLCLTEGSCGCLEMKVLWGFFFSRSLLYGWIDFCLQGSGSTCWDHFPEMKPEKEQKQTVPTYKETSLQIGQCLSHMPEPDLRLVQGGLIANLFLSPQPNSPVHQPFCHCLPQWDQDMKNCCPCSDTLQLGFVSGRSPRERTCKHLPSDSSHTALQS